MTEKRYKIFEKFVMGVVFTVGGSIALAFLLGVYALANLVF